ncbi:hypothetical protein [Streptomyces griseorubiginosus]|uniref:hypothetical protein n=1 Tax=Streptomyces griseorubiginosus TaxID=67304 RepID=UPI00331839B6
MNTDPKTVGDLVAETTVLTDTKTFTVSTVRLDVASYDTTVFDDSDDRRHHGMRLGNYWTVGWGQQSGTLDGALALQEEAVHAAYTEEPTELAQ